MKPFILTQWSTTSASITSFNIWYSRKIHRKSRRRLLILAIYPTDLFRSPQSDYRLAGAALARTINGEKPHIDYNYSGTDVSIFVLDRETIDKSASQQVQHNGKTYFVGSCPKFHYVIGSARA